jgi:hypothetical protein
MDIGTPLSLAGGVESLLPPGSPATSSQPGGGFLGGLVDTVTRPFSLDPNLIEREALRITEQNKRATAKIKTNSVKVPGNRSAQ